LQEEAIVLMQDNIEGLWESFAEKYRKVLGPEVSARNITHAMGLVSFLGGRGECVGVYVFACVGA
jgi:hypothetical protein